MKSNFNILLAAIVFAITIFGFIYFVTTKDDGSPQLINDAKLLEKREIPSISLLEVGTNRDFSDEIRGGEIMLVYMMSSCEACMKETQTIAQIQSKTNTKIFGVMFEDEDVVKSYIKEHNVKFPVLIDKDKKLLESLSIKYFPANLKLKDGVVQKALFGSPEDENILLEFIKSGV